MKNKLTSPLVDTPPKKRRRVQNSDDMLLPPFLMCRPDAQEIINVFTTEIKPGDRIPENFQRRMMEDFELAPFQLDMLQTWIYPNAGLGQFSPALGPTSHHEEDVPPQGSRADSPGGGFRPYMPDPMEMHRGAQGVYTHDDEEDEEEDSHEKEPSDSEKTPHLAPPAFTRHLSQFPEEYLDGHYRVEKYIGKGAYGIVASAVATKRNPKVEAGKRVAIKKMSNIFRNVFGTKRLLRELKVLRALSGHDCIVKLLDIKIPHPKDINDFDTILLVFEWIEWDLNKLMKMDIFLSERQVKAVLKRILYGIKYMHSADIVHRDLKPANILLNSKVEVKVCDFGLSRCIKENVQTPVSMSQELMPEDDPNQLKPLPFKPKLTQHVVTRYYRAPEVCMKEQSRELLPKIDVWSIGCIFAELLQMLQKNCETSFEREILFPGVCDEMLTPPNPSERGVTKERLPRDQLQVIFDFCGTPEPELIKKVRNAKMREWLRSLPPREPEELKLRFPHGPPKALDLLEKFLILDPEKRISVDEALDHPWLRDYEDVKSKKDHEGVHFTFEDVPLTRHLLRSLIVDEILYYNEDLRDQLVRQHSQNENSQKLVEELDDLEAMKPPDMGLKESSI